MLSRSNSLISSFLLIYLRLRYFSVVQIYIAFIIKNDKSIIIIIKKKKETIQNLNYYLQPIDFNKKCTCTSFQQSKPFQKLQFAKKPIAKIVLFCVWMIKKITTIMKEVSNIV